MTEVITMPEVFRPTDTVFELDGKKYRLIYDMLAFCELEKIYGSVDVVLGMLFGDVAQKLEPVVTYKDSPIDIDDVKVDDVPLALVLAEKDKQQRVAKHSDTLELLWAGMIHDNAIYNSDDEIIGYKISKRKVAESITFRNYRSLNVKIVEAIMKDLAPGLGEGDSKNEEIAEAPREATTPVQSTQ